MTQDIIMERMLERVSDTFNKEEGSFVYDALAPLAIELAEAYIQLDQVLNLGFAETSYGDYMDKRASEFGLTRKSATSASTIVTVTGTVTKVVDTGTIFATESGIQFITTETVTIPDSGNVNIPVEAVNAGALGNVPSGTIITIPYSIDGVTSVTNVSAASGGADIESDDLLLSRLLSKVRTPITSGNAYHYLNWALEVEGVGDAKVYPTWNGVGTVKLVLLGQDKTPVTADVATEVYDYIETVRPIGVTVTAIPAVEEVVNVACVVTLEDGYTEADVNGLITQQITDYFKEIAFIEDQVSRAQIGSMILAVDGVKDYTTLTLNGVAENVSLIDDVDDGDDQTVEVVGRVPSIGTVTLS